MTRVVQFETCSNPSCEDYDTELESGILDECPRCAYPLLLKTRSSVSSEDGFIELVGRVDRA